MTRRDSYPRTVYLYPEDDPRRKLASAEYAALRISEAATYLALDMTPERLALIARRVVEWGWTEHAITSACGQLVDVPEYCDPVRRYGAITPADLRRALPRQPKTSFVDYSEVTYSDKPIPRPSDGKKENLRRLKAGTVTPPRGTPEWDAHWKEYYGNDYVMEVQQIARKYLGLDTEDA